MRLKDDEAAKREQRLTKQHERDLQLNIDAYEEQCDELHQENAKLKNANLFLENDMHALLLEHEKNSKLISSSFYYLGLMQVQRDRERDKASRGMSGGAGEEGAGLDWLESQKGNVYAYGYESIFRTGQ